MLEFKGKLYGRWTDSTSLYPQCGRLEDHPPLRSHFQVYLERLGRLGAAEAAPFGSEDQ